jgi:hypothetical protein
MKRLYVLVAVIAIVAFMPAGRAAADNENNGLQAVPFTFVGTAADCAPYPAGSRIVTAAWLAGMGLPDNGGANTSDADLATNPNKSDPHSGLLLNKNGPTADCSSSGARITGVRGMTVTAGFEVGFDYRLGTHCGAGAPRFNIDTDQGFFFVGCAAAAQSPAPQDPLQWFRMRSVLATCTTPCSPGPIPVGARINSISILYDEGTDNPVGTSDPAGVGLAVVDNIYINGQYIRSGPRAGSGNGRGNNNNDGNGD